MQTTLLGAGAVANPTSGASATSDMFTKLLVAQIKNQDPTSPTDPSTFVNQLAQLSQTESLQNLSDLTSANASVLQSMQVIAMGAQVGSTVTATTTTVQLGTSPVQGGFTLPDATTRATIVLTGADGAAHAVDLGPHGKGDVAFTLDPAALGLPAGAYDIAVRTDAKTGPDVQVTGTLASVKLSSTGAVALVVDDLGEISPSAVTAFLGPVSAAPSH